MCRIQLTASSCWGRDRQARARTSKSGWGSRPRARASLSRQSMTSLKRPGALYDRGRRFRGRFGEISVSRRASECAVTKAESLRLDFAKAVARLDEALTLPKDQIVRHSAIQYRSVPGAAVGGRA